MAVADGMDIGRLDRGLYYSVGDIQHGLTVHSQTPYGPLLHIPTQTYDA